MSESETRRLRHVVLFAFDDETTGEEIAEVVEAFSRLPEEIDVITDFEHGVDVSVEHKQKGFTHGFLLTFSDEQGRDEYLPHPAHQAFGQLVRPRVKDVLVFDYWAE
mgnify:CR=1 FL=1